MKTFLPGTGPLTQALDRAMAWAFLGAASMFALWLAVASWFFGGSETYVFLHLPDPAGTTALLVLMGALPTLPLVLVLMELRKSWRARKLEPLWPPHFLSLTIAGAFVVAASTWTAVLLVALTRKAIL